MTDEREAKKRRAAREAAATVADGAVVGLGSGTTAAAAIRSLGERKAEGLEIVGVPTSYQAADTAREVGIPVRSPADVDGIDVAIDGADQVAGGDLIKGGGGAHAREKVIDTAAERCLIVVDDAKVGEVLDMPVPLETLPDARPLVAEELHTLGATPHVRRTDAAAPIVTDNGNHVIDADFGAIEAPAELGAELAGIPGVLEHGLFVGIADAIHVGYREDVGVVEP